MTFQVFHARTTQDKHGRVTGIRGSFGMTPTAFPDDFELVATVEAPTIHDVFQLTNHIDGPWTDNPQVTVAPGVQPFRLRSTSVGDVVGSAKGYFRVSPVGFTFVRETASK